MYHISLVLYVDYVWIDDVYVKLLENVDRYISDGRWICEEILKTVIRLARAYRIRIMTVLDIWGSSICMDQMGNYVMCRNGYYIDRGVPTVEFGRKFRPVTRFRIDGNEVRVEHLQEF